MATQFFHEMTEAVNWLPAPERPVLRGGAEVHIWRADLRGDDLRDASRLEGLLSEDERERAARFRFQKHRRRFVVARAGLRRVLGSYLALAPEEVKFRYSEFGKSMLDWAANAGVPHQPLFFNVSHSGDMAVIAVASGGDVGVDVEKINPDFPWRDVAEQVFTADEIKWLRAFEKGDARDDGEKTVAAFFALWTCKEAFLKARGEGFSGDPKSVSILFQNQAPSLRDDVLDAARWSLRLFNVGANFAAALAFNQSLEKIECFDVPEHDESR